MKGDFSRFRFDPTRRYTAVLAQQGRVVTDADLNEEHAIQEYRAERAMADVAGRVAAPRGDDGTAPGFAIDVDAGNALRIGAGRLHVDGLLLENDAPLGYAQQPFWGALASPAPDVAAQLLAAGTPLGLVYLEATRRTVTALDDDAIREIALGGPDTSVRAQVTWTVRTLPLALAANGVTLTDANVQALANAAEARREAEQRLATATGPEARRAARRDLATRRRALRELAESLQVTCRRAWTEWSALEAPATGRVRIAAIAGAGVPGPCDVPAGTGYFGAEHQTYRVEVHATDAAGSRAATRLKFSRENGAVLTAIVPPAGAGAAVSGTVLRVTTLGRDATLGFAAGQWVEYVDDVIEQAGVAGPLRLVQATDPTTGELVLASSLTYRPGARPKLRRWDQQGAAATADGLAPDAAGVVPLEANLEARLDAGTYRVGDWWIVPARSGLPDTQFPAAPQPPGGPVRHRARLALVLRDARGALRVLHDCRPVMPALTALDARDVGYEAGCDRLAGARTVEEALDQLCATQGGRCTLTAVPGPGWERVLDQLADGAHAEICFPVGTYPVPANGAVLAKKGHVILAGTGPGSRIEAAEGAIALALAGCASVTVRDMAVHAQRPASRTGVGTITALGCDLVRLVDVDLACADAPPPPPMTTGAPTPVALGACVHAVGAGVPSGTPATTLQLERVTLRAGRRQSAVQAVNVVDVALVDCVVQVDGFRLAADALPTGPNESPTFGVLDEPLFVARPELLVDEGPVRPAPQPQPQPQPPVGDVRPGRPLDPRIADPRVVVPEPRVPAQPSPTQPSPAPPAPAPSRTTDVTERRIELRDTIAEGLESMRARFGDAFAGLFRPPTGGLEVVLPRPLRPFPRPVPPTGRIGVAVVSAIPVRLRVERCTVRGFEQGIVVVGPQAPRQGPVERIVLRANRIEVPWREDDAAARAGIRCAHVDDLVAEYNEVLLDLVEGRAAVEAAIDVRGTLGPRLVLRGNATDGFAAGIRVQHAPGEPPKTRLWLATENVSRRALRVAEGTQYQPALSEALANVLLVT